MGWARHCQAGCHVHGQVLLARLEEDALALASASVSVLAAAALAKCCYVKVFYVMGKALSDLSSPCDRSCFFCSSHM